MQDNVPYVTRPKLDDGRFLATVFFCPVSDLPTTSRFANHGACLFSKNVGAPAVRRAPRAPAGAIHWVSTYRTWYVNLGFYNSSADVSRLVHQPVIGWTAGSVFTAHHLAKNLKQIETPIMLAAFLMRRYLLVGGVKQFHLWVRSWQSRIERLISLVLQPLTDVFVHNLTGAVVVDLSVTWSRGASNRDVWNALGTLLTQQRHLFQAIAPSELNPALGDLDVTQLKQQWFSAIIRSRLLARHSHTRSRAWASQSLLCTSFYFSQRKVYIPVRGRNYSRIKKRITKKLVKQTQRRLWVF